jgi:hypothetical protein
MGLSVPSLAGLYPFLRRQRKKPAMRAASRPTPSPTPSPTRRATLFVDPPDFGAVVADAKVVGTASTEVALADELGTVEVADGVDVWV